MARSVWSAWSLLPLSNHTTHPTAGASSTHSIRFAKHDGPCPPHMQFAPDPSEKLRKKASFSDILSSPRGCVLLVRRRAEDRRAPPAVTDRLRGSFRHWLRREHGRIEQRSDAEGRSVYRPELQFAIVDLNTDEIFLVARINIAM